MKEISIVTTQAFSLINFRGDLISLLVAEGWKVTCIATDFDDETINYFKSRNISTVKISGNRADLNLTSEIYFFIDLFRTICKLKPDVVLLYFIKPIVYGSIITRILKIKRRVLLIEGLGYIFTEKKFYIKYLMRPLVSLLYILSLNLSSKIIVLNNEDKKLISSMTYDKAKIMKINGIGVNLNKFKRNTDESNKVKVFDFGFFGRFLVHKGVLEIISASKILREKGYSIKIGFWGYVDENPTSVTLSQVMQWDKEGLINYMGFSSNVATDMTKCKAVLLPSYREALPRSIQEAAALSIPAIVTDVPGCNEVVLDKVTGLLCRKGDPHDLAAKMELYLKNEYLVTEHGSAAMIRARTIYDSEDINRHFLDILSG